MSSSMPVLYTFRRCPYAIRARLAIAASGTAVQSVEVDLKAKPRQLLDISPKATVPVLALPDGTVIDESLDIMVWALSQRDPDGMLASFEPAKALIQRNDGPFKQALDRYKYPERYPGFSAPDYRQQGEVFLAQLNRILQVHRYLCGDRTGIADLAILPFVRQFAQVDRAWFDASPYPKLRDWLNVWLSSPLFTGVFGAQAYVPGMK